MHISKLKIKNFKCFDEVEINFDPNFNLIIGENNSGKSTIFEALRLWQLAIQQFYSKRTGKKGDGSNNISFYRKYQFEPLEIGDLSFLRIDNFSNILNKKINLQELNDDDNFIKNTFLIELTFSNLDGNQALIPIIFRPNDKNILRCRIGLNDKLTFEDLKTYSHSLSKVMDLVNNDSFINRIRLAYIPPKFTLPNIEVLLSENNSFILEKLIKGESQNVIRNILHHWCEFSYQTKTKEKKAESIEKSKQNLAEIIDPNTFSENFNIVKPYIENVLDFEVRLKRNTKSKFLKSIEIGLKKIVNQTFDFISENNPIDNYVLQIKEKGNNTEISQLGSGTINVLNILSVLSYNEQTIENATKCNILLLDEPDSHLQFNLQDKLFDYLHNQSKDEKKQIFIITHNSSLISQFDNILFIKKGAKSIHPISMDDYLENHLKEIDDNHYNVMKDLHNAKIEKEDAERQKEDVEKQLKTIQNLEVPLVFTEGPSDVIILKNAFEKLYPQENLKFQLVNGFSCTQLKNTFENEKTFEKNNQPHIAVFDFDTAYSQWNGLWNGKNEKKYDFVEENPYKALSKKHNNFNAYAILLPVPEIKLIKNQVIDPDNENINFGDKSVLQIEHLFYDVNSCSESFETRNIVGGGKCIIFKDDKIKFAENTKKLSKKDFKHFVPLFEKIAEIIGFELPKVVLDA